MQGGVVAGSDLAQLLLGYLHIVIHLVIEADLLLTVLYLKIVCFLVQLIKSFVGTHYLGKSHLLLELGEPLI